MMDLKDKKISVLGAVRSGVNAAKLIKSMGGIPFVSDTAAREKIAANLEMLAEENIDFEFGAHTERVFDAELIVTSPGVPSDSEVLLKAQAKNIQVISEVELASNFCGGKIIAITGTNGKTTTTTLCGYMLNESGHKAYTAGNIGNAFSSIAAEVKADEFVALETSSFQLDHIKDFKPFISVILNITPDHLDRYGHDMNNYVASKLKIFSNQDENSYAILFADDQYLPKQIDNQRVNVIYYSLKNRLENGAYLYGDRIIYKKNGVVEFECHVRHVNLQGEHNYANCMVNIIIAKILGIDNEKIMHVLKTFKGVEHRLEFVRELDGVKFINDSKATNVDSVWYALQAYDDPMFLILGGKDKGNDYNQIKGLVVDKVKKIYAIGSSADKVFNFFHQMVKVEVKKTLEECVLAANSEARDGDIVLLSPACASQDMFTDYEHRGRVFKEAVNNL